jgi:hypothetical protein
VSDAERIYHRKGTPVRYWPGWRTGPSKIGRIREDGIAEIGGTNCQYVAGAGAVALGHIVPLPFTHGVIEVATVEEALDVADWDDVLTVNISNGEERKRMQKVMVKLV